MDDLDRFSPQWMLFHRESLKPFVGSEKVLLDAQNLDCVQLHESSHNDICENSKFWSWRNVTREFICIRYLIIVIHNASPVDHSSLGESYIIPQCLGSFLKKILQSRSLWDTSWRNSRCTNYLQSNCLLLTTYPK